MKGLLSSDYYAVIYHVEKGGVDLVQLTLHIKSNRRKVLSGTPPGWVLVAIGCNVSEAQELKKEFVEELKERETHE